MTTHRPNYLSRILWTCAAVLVAIPAAYAGTYVALADTWINACGTTSDGSTWRCKYRSYPHSRLADFFTPAARVEEYLSGDLVEIH